ncbi:MAG: hypothetical protein Q9159_001840 [Coniocarpon cinnabarinum]
MERSPSPKKHFRPKPSRTSSNVDSNIASPSALRHALPTLHLPSRHHHPSEKNKRHAERHPVSHAAVHSPTNVPNAIAEKFSSSRPNLRPSQTPHESTFQVNEKGTSLSRISTNQSRPIDVAKERHRRVRREEELQSTLNSLSDLASSNTRRVDLLWMGLLEKISTLQNTIKRMQELSDETDHMREGYEKEASQVEDEYERQIDAFKGFEEQQHQAESLRSRIEASMQRSGSLQERLRAAREHVSRWERREDEWQAKTALKLRIGWACFGALVVLILLGFIIHALFFKASPEILTERPLHAMNVDALWNELSIARPSGRAWQWSVDSSSVSMDESRLKILDDL